ncbi:hypothetical protein [Candidatus Palauibacter sp.]|uniref:hypothetical protein n=1 Tax=Candidatus Palauibacter sp. TaxID=3101350 RepID=UPI003B5CA0E2
MRRNVVVRLSRLHVYRTVKPLWKVGLAMGVVMVLPPVFSGALNPDFTVGVPAGLLVLLPVTAALNVTGEKIDGSLRFLASLPVTGREHTVSRLAAAATLAMPLVIHLATLLPLFGLMALPGAFIVAVSAGIAAVLVSLLGVALQYRFSGQKVRSMFSMLAAALVALAWMSTLFEGWLAVILTPAGIVALLLISLIGVMAGSWYALRAIARLAPVYERDRDELTTGGKAGPTGV